MSSSDENNRFFEMDMDSTTELDVAAISTMLRRKPVITGPIASKKLRRSTSASNVSDNDLFVTHLLAAFKDFELHLSLFSRTVAEDAPTWSDIEKSILSQRESIVESSSRVSSNSKELTLDDVACILHVTPELYTLTYHCDETPTTINTIEPNKLFIQTVDGTSSSSGDNINNGNVEIDVRRHVSSTLERRKIHFREKLFSLVTDANELAKLVLINCSNLISAQSFVKIIDTSAKRGNTGVSTGGATGSVSSSMGYTQTTHESTSGPLPAHSSSSDNGGNTSLLSLSNGLNNKHLPVARGPSNQLIDTIRHYTQLKPIEMASPIKHTHSSSSSSSSSNHISTSASDSVSNSVNVNSKSSHNNSSTASDRIVHQQQQLAASQLPVSPLPSTTIDSNSNSNGAFDMNTLRAMAIERGKQQKSLQEILTRETEYQNQLNRLQSVVPIADEIQQIFNRMNRSSYVLSDIFELLCNTAAKRKQSEVAYIIQNILVKQASEYFLIVARDNICPQSSLSLNFYVKYSQIRSKLLLFVDSEKRDIASKLQQLRSSV